MLSSIFFPQSTSRRPLWTWIPLLIIALGVYSNSSTAQTQTQTQKPALSPERLQEHIESFEYVWNSVKTKHWDPDLNGVDWDQAKIDLLPKVQNATTDNQARAAINELLGRLEQSHFSIIPSSSYKKLKEESTVIDDSDDSDDPTNNNPQDADPEPGYAGMNIRLVADQFLVTKVVQDAPASKAGIKTGWIVESIRGRAMDSLLKITKEIDGVMRPETQAGLIINARLQGDTGDTLNMTFTDGDNQTQERTLTFDKAPGIVGSFGELPEMLIEVEADTLQDGIGYFRLNMFMSPGTVLPTYQSFIKNHMDAPGIVIDMRGNYGGIILMAPGMINWLISEKDLTLGTMKMRDQLRGSFEIPLMLNPRRKNYTGKIAVLIDEMSISNAEILAAGLKDIGRAKIFGTRTAGLVLPSTVERLPNGDGFQYAFASYTTGGGYILEGIGAIPDVDIQYTRNGLLDGRDEVLDAATDWINCND
ncbi:MAG: hypothetical protein JKY43_09405 [Phycisphaerales bacterium]|nr:hypothetical protein [Phycisphaerales bacterium]